MASHYDSEYFAWQKVGGQFGGEANLIKFESFIKPEDRVVDFGCGGGFLLKKLNCREKMGVEINPYAIKHAKSLGLSIVESPHLIPDEWADVIVSDNCLEHTSNPLGEIKALYPKLKKGGRMIFVVASETILMRYKTTDINHHLFSWSPLSLGNLFKEAGYRVIKSEPFIHKWPPQHDALRALVKKNMFDFICRIYGHLKWDWFQVRIIATRDS